MNKERLKELLQVQFSELHTKFTTLSLNKQVNRFIIEGLVCFEVEHEGIVIRDEYSIRIHIPQDYPDSFPLVEEIGGKIPIDFHRNKDDNNTLCLGTPYAVQKKFKECRTLFFYVDQQVVPFLFSYSYYCKYHEMPFDELSHGGSGIVEYYSELFSVDDPVKIVGFLHILADNVYLDHRSCPCGSDLRLCECHGNQVMNLRNTQSEKYFLYEYSQVKEMIESLGLPIPKDYCGFTKKWGKRR
ncbi:hypothetical protein KAU32_04680 [bacterium]|nr:hypothetical protein [bacterium]